MKTFIALVVGLMSFSLYADQSCLIRTTNKLARQFLHQRGYQLVSQNEASAHFDLELETYRKRLGPTKVGIVFNSTEIEDISSIAVFSQSFEVFGREIDNSGTKYHTSKDYQFPDKSIDQLKLLEDFENRFLRSAECE